MGQALNTPHPRFVLNFMILPVQFNSVIIFDIILGLKNTSRENVEWTKTTPRSYRAKHYTWLAIRQC